MRRRDAVLILAAGPAAAADFVSKWPASTEQIWLGPEYWANRLQDWRVANGRIECTKAGGDRNVFLLTHELSARAEAFETRVKLGRLDNSNTEGFAGFRVGMKGPFNDYRDTAIYGIGLDAGLTADGRLFIGDPQNASSPVNGVSELVLKGDASGGLVLAALDAGGKELARVTHKQALSGGVALVCHSGEYVRQRNNVTMSGINRPGRENEGEFRVWFRDWKVSGAKVDVHSDRAWGPILFALHTLSRRVLKLTAQMAPVNTDGPVTLLAKGKKVAEARIDPLARTATFRVPNWDDTRDTPYTVVYGKDKFEGTVRRDPTHKPKILAAALSCVNDLGFPHTEIVNNLKHHKADVLMFLGDQIYERSAGYGIERLPVTRAALDYLRKWYIFGWSFRDLLRDTPSVCMPDDHDVYHGNVWGAGGRHAEGFGQEGQDSGGYMEPAEWVNTIQRTQTSHLPDPFDPTPVEQGITVYYTDWLYGGVSFAIIEDRKWKSAPKPTMPAAKIVNGWVQNPNWNAARDGDVPGAQLLGPRQMEFLNKWVADWKGAWIKAAISQTLFANLATLPAPATTDSVTPKLPILKPGEYPEGEMKTADHDSNGWPRTPRNEALRVIRRAMAVHICGDQHLGSTVQYGVEDWNDAAWAVCTPAVSNLFPRRWYPPQPGANRKPGAARNMGEYLDGFGNRITVHAVFNPSTVAEEPVSVNHRAPGYTIVEFDRKAQTTTLANWARYVDASKPGAKPCEGWPITVRQKDNGLPKTGWRLDPVIRAGVAAVVEVREEPSGAHVYTYRMVEAKLDPPVPGEGVYTVIVRNDSGEVAEIRRNQRAQKFSEPPITT